MLYVVSLPLSFGLLGLSWFFMELSSSYKLSIDYRPLYLKERLNYLIPLYLVGVAALVLSLIGISDPWSGVYIGFVTILGLTVGGRVFINGMRRGFRFSMDVYDLNLDLLIVSTAVSLIAVNNVVITFILLVITNAVFLLETLIMYGRVRKKLFDIGARGAIIYSVPLLVFTVYSLILSISNVLISVISILIMTLFLVDLGHLVFKGMY